MRPRIPLKPLCAALVFAAILPSAQAADDAALTQARNQTRRAQQALTQAQNDLAAVQQQTQRLDAENARLKAQLAQAQQAQAALQHQGAAARAQAQSCSSREQAAHVQAQQALGAASAQLEATGTQLAQAQADLTEQRRLTTHVGALLARSTEALAAAEQANHRLLALGLQAADAHAQGCASTDDDVRAGLRAVRLQDEAEALRKAMHAQQVVQPR